MCHLAGRMHKNEQLVAFGVQLVGSLRNGLAFADRQAQTDGVTLRGSEGNFHCFSWWGGGVFVCTMGSSLSLGPLLSTIGTRARMSALAFDLSCLYSTSHSTLEYFEVPPAHFSEKKKEKVCLSVLSQSATYAFMHECVFCGLLERTGVNSFPFLGVTYWLNQTPWQVQDQMESSRILLGIILPLICARCQHLKRNVYILHTVSLWERAPPAGAAGDQSI